MLTPEIFHAQRRAATGGSNALSDAVTEYSKDVPIDAVPMPDFIHRPGPAVLPTVAPAPAPIDPSATGPSEADCAAA